MQAKGSKGNASSSGEKSTAEDKQDEKAKVRVPFSFVSVHFTANPATRKVQMKVRQEESLTVINRMTSSPLDHDPTNHIVFIKWNKVATHQPEYILWSLPVLCFCSHPLIVIVIVHIVSFYQMLPYSFFVSTLNFQHAASYLHSLHEFETLAVEA